MRESWDMQVHRHMEYTQKSVYVILGEIVQSAFYKAYPEYINEVLVIPFTSIVPDSRIDLSTSFPFKAAKRYSIPLMYLQNNLVLAIDWNNEFFHDTRNIFYSKGFINFKLSSNFIHRLVYNAGVTPLEHKIVSGHNGSHTLSRNIFLVDLYQIVNKFDVSMRSQTFEAYNWHRLSTDEEMRIIRTIALSDPLQLHSSNAKRYFCERLISEVKRLYVKHSIFSNDDELTYLRLFLINASIKRISSLLFTTNIRTSQ